jgi:predicted DCC family thiol-disulfide oxidoreductase YuxK
VSNGWTGGQYSIFRVLLGTYLFIHFAHLLAWGAELFSNGGMLGNRSHSPLFGLVPSVLSISDSPAMVVGLLLVAAVAAVFFAIGKHDRIAALAMWYVLACLFGRNPLIANPALPYLGWMLLAHLFVPSAPWGALAAKGRTDPAGDWQMPRPIFLAAWIVLALSYSYSGYTKLQSPSWVNGDTVWYVVHNPLARDYFVRDLVLWFGENFSRALTWTVLWVEVLFAPLALFRRLRPILWAIMLVVQFGFLLLLNFADLTTPMLLFHLLTFDPAWLKPISARGPETVYYDGDCGLCHRVVRFALAEDRANHFRFAPLQGPSFAREVPGSVRASLPDTFVIGDDLGRVLTKSDAAIHMLERLGGLWRLLGTTFRLLPKGLSDLGYDWVGRIRHRLFPRPDGMCPLLPEGLRTRFAA